MEDKIYYVMRDMEIIFSGTAAECKRIAAKVEDSRIEPPLKSKKKPAITAQEFWNIGWINFSDQSLGIWLIVYLASKQKHIFQQAPEPRREWNLHLYYIQEV